MVNFDFPVQTVVHFNNDYEDYINKWIVHHRSKDVRIVLGPQDESELAEASVNQLILEEVKHFEQTELGEPSVDQLILEEQKHFDDIYKSDVQVVDAKTKTMNNYLPDTRKSLKKPKQAPPQEI